MTNGVEWTRRRVIATVVLVILIGIVGAFVLPRLVHEPPAAGGRLDASLYLSLPEAGLAEPGGTLHLEAEGPGRSPLDVSVDVPAGVKRKDLLHRLAAEVKRHGWAGTEGTGGLHLADVSLVSVDPGRGGYPATLSVSFRKGRPGPLDVVVSGERGKAKGRVTLELGAGGQGLPDAGASADVAGQDAPADVLDRLATALSAQGCQVDVRPAGDGTTARLHLERGRDGGGILTLVLTVSLEGDAAGWTWAIHP